MTGLLYLIGVGFQPEHLNIAAREAIAKCDKVFAENYTMEYDFPSLGRIIGKRIEILPREEVEQGNSILENAKKKNIAFLVPGDALTATTHFSIISSARDMGISYGIVHNISIFSAIAETGLHIYKFGKTTSIPFPQEGFEPTSFYDVIKQNLSIGAHTLVLLDTNMSARRGLEFLLKASGRNGRIKPGTMVVVAHISGKSRIFYGRIEDVSKLDIPEPCCIVIPAELHFTEKEILEKLYKVV